MKWISLGLLVLGSLALTAQVPAQNPEDRIRMMQRSMTLLDRPVGEKPTGMLTPPGKVSYTADSVNVDGGIVKLSGHVRIATSTFIVTADEAEYRRDSGQIDPHGEVHIRMLAPKK